MALTPIGRSDVVIPEDLAKDIVKSATQASTVLSLPGVNIRRMSRKEHKIPVSATLATAAWVAEEGTKSQSTATWDSKTITAEELAAIVTVHDSVLDDADFDLFDEIKPQLAEAIASAFDAAVLFGTNAPASFPNSVVEHAVAAGYEIEDGAGQDLAADVNAAMALVEDDGYAINGHVARLAVKSRLRGLRDDNGQPIFVSSLANDGAAASLYGEAIAFSANGAWDPDAATLATGDFSKLCIGLRQDLTFTTSKEATVGGVSLFETDRTALRVVFRAGFQIVAPPTRENATPCPFAIVSDQVT